MSETPPFSVPPFSKKGQRSVSSFVGQELLYDFVTDQLDAERKKAVTEFVQKNKDAQMDILKIENGITYAQKLGETKVSEALLEKVTEPASYLELMIQKTRYNKWSPALKLAFEGSIVALGVISLVILVPWHRLMDLKLASKEVVLSEIDNQYSKKTKTESETPSKEEDSFPDEGAPAAAAAAAVAKNSPSTTTTTLPVAPPVVKPEAQLPATALVATAAPVVPVPPTPPPAPTPVAKPSKQASVAATENEKKPVGELYRGRIFVTNVPAITPKLVDKIAELGGRKAGQVELGWNKSDSSYFHFTMPQTRYDELVEYFKEYGNLKIQKEKHERVMPDGVMRLIITVEEKQ